MKSNRASLSASVRWQAFHFPIAPDKRQKLLSLCCLIVFAFASSAVARGVPPNIIVILADDLGYGDVGFNGCPDYPTPNIDSIASNGVLCTDGYVTDAVCSPSRASVLTGRYQQQFGHEHVPIADASSTRLGLPMFELLLPQILKPAGYVSGAIGKWHLGMASNFHPMNRGFDEFFGFLGGAANYFNTTVLRDYTPTRETAYLTDAFTREGVSFINRHATQPFLLYLAYNAPHKPYQAPQSYLDRVAYISDPDRRLLAAMVTALDDGVGQVLQTLEANNLLDKTLIFFLSDNGAPETGFTRNLPLRGYKLNTLEGGIRVPFAVQWTGRLPAHGVYEKPVSSLDVVVTAAAAAGVSLPADRVYDGMDIVRYLAGEQISPPRKLFWRSFGLGSDGPPGSQATIWAVRSDELKLVTERGTVDEPPALYNLPNDMGETQNLAASQPDDVASLKKLYDKWNLHKVSPLWQSASDFCSSLTLVGDWNGFNKDDQNFPWRLTRIIAPPEVNGTPDGFNWFTNTIHVAATGGDTTPGLHYFAILGDSSYSNQWGGVVPININATTSIPFFSGIALGPLNSISLADGFYYSFRILDPVHLRPDNLGIAVMKTSAPPILVDRSGQTPVTPTPDDPIVVRIVTNQPRSPKERIYLRWSTDLFITSQLVRAAGSGVNYSATIPAQPARTRIEYSIITSTVDLSPFFTSGIIDSLTLAASGTFKVDISEATPTPTPSPTPAP
jgi:arylsulfatase A-like enzyme